MDNFAAMRQQATVRQGDDSAPAGAYVIAEHADHIHDIGRASAAAQTVHDVAVELDLRARLNIHFDNQRLVDQRDARRNDVHNGNVRAESPARAGNAPLPGRQQG